MEKSRPYFEVLHAALSDIAASNAELSSPYIARRPVKKTCYVVIAGDRGLAGGYNANILKAVAAEAEGKENRVLPVGKRRWSITSAGASSASPNSMPRRRM